ncbi:transglycosylase SLT domain-containing protein [Candidatus Aquicultor sp.]
MLLLLAPTALASQLDDKRTKLKNIDAQIKATEAKQSAVAKQQDEALRQIQASNQKMVRAQKQLNSMQTQLNDMIAKRKDADARLRETQQRLDATHVKLVDAQKRLALRRGVFNKRLINAYKNKSLSIVSVLLGSENFNDLINRIAFIGMIAKADSKIVFNMKQLTATISSEIAQVEVMKNAISEQREYLVAEEHRINAKKGGIIAQQKQLQDEASKQQKLYAIVQQEKARLAQSTSLLRTTSNIIAGQINALEKRSSGIGDTNRAPSISAGNLSALAAKTAKKYGIPTKLFFALIKQESGWNYRAVSSSGAIGLTQVMPFNITAMGYNISEFKNSPSQQLEAGASYLSMQFKTFGRWDYALAAYNAGPGAVLQYGGIPPYKETRNYVRSILAMAGR